MDKDTVPAVFRAPDDHSIAATDIAKFTNLDLASLIDGDAVHAAFPGQQPLVIDFEILRENAGGMVVIRCDTILWRWFKSGWRSAVQFRGEKIRRLIGGQ